MKQLFCYLSFLCTLVFSCTLHAQIITVTVTAPPYSPGAASGSGMDGYTPTGSAVANMGNNASFITQAKADAIKQACATKAATAAKIDADMKQLVADANATFRTQAATCPSATSEGGGISGGGGINRGPFQFQITINYAIGYSPHGTCREGYSDNAVAKISQIEATAASQKAALESTCP